MLTRMVVDETVIHVVYTGLSIAGCSGAVRRPALPQPVDGRGDQAVTQTQYLSAGVEQYAEVEVLAGLGAMSGPPREGSR